MSEMMVGFLQRYREYLLPVDGMVLSAALLWQLYLIMRIDPRNRGSGRRFLPVIAFIIPDIVPKRVVLPFLFGLMVLIGTASYSYFEYKNTGYFYDIFWENMQYAFLFFLLIVGKTWFGPLTLAFSVVFVLHQLSQGITEPSWIPDFLQDVIEPIFERLPKVIYVLYTLVSLLYVACSSITDTISGGHFSGHY